MKTYRGLPDISDEALVKVNGVLVQLGNKTKRLFIEELSKRGEEVLSEKYRSLETKDVQYVMDKLKI